MANKDIMKAQKEIFEHINRSGCENPERCFIIELILTRLNTQSKPKGNNGNN